MKRRSLLALAGAFVLTACSGVKPYADQGPGNMQLKLFLKQENTTQFVVEKNMLGKENIQEIDLQDIKEIILPISNKDMVTIVV